MGNEAIQKRFKVHLKAALIFFCNYMASFFCKEKPIFQILVSCDISIQDFRKYSVSHIITYASKELCSKMALGEVGVSFP